MITVSAGFKTAMQAVSKKLYAYLDDGVDEITEADDLKRLKLYTESSLLRTVLRKAEIDYFGTHDYLESDVNLGLGVEVSGSPEYIDYGTFKVVKAEIQKDEETMKLTAYGKMYEALIDWDLEEDVDITYPTTLLGLLQAICTKLSWTLDSGSTTFPNYDEAISADELTGVVKTYRQALDYIAEASGSIIYFDVDDELVVAQIDKTTSLETLSAIGTGVLNTMKVGSKWGEVNSVSLSRSATDDTILQQDESSISANGLTELKIVDNLIVDGNREDWIGDIFTALEELEFYPFEASTNGAGYFQIGDRLTLEDLSSNTYEVVVFGIETTMTGALSEKLWCEVPDKTTSDYNTSGIIGQKITNTEIIVNKQEGEIELINTNLSNNYYTASEITLLTDSIISSVENNSSQINTALDDIDTNDSDIQDIFSDITTLEQRADSLELAIENVGGTNLFKNSVGLKGTIEEWQLLDEEGDLIDADNDATIDQSTNVEINSESGSALRLDEQYIEETFPTIEGETYTLYMRHYGLLDALIQITGISDITVSAETEFTVFKYQFTATASTTTIRFTNVDSGAGAYIVMTDIICKLGDASGWVQAPNEVYGANYKFDKDGFEITSLTDTFKSVLDNQKFAVYDTAGGEKIIMFISKDSGRVTNLTAQEQFILQRYENSEKSARFIPTSTGFMLVIND